MGEGTEVRSWWSAHAGKAAVVLLLGLVAVVVWSGAQSRSAERRHQELQARIESLETQRGQLEHQVQDLEVRRLIAEERADDLRGTLDEVEAARRGFEAALRSAEDRVYRLEHDLEARERELYEVEYRLEMLMASGTTGNGGPYEGSKNGGGADRGMPPFPSPVPVPTDRRAVDVAVFDGPDTLGDVEWRFLEAMDATAYGSCSFYGFGENGIAVVTRLQQFGEGGVPVEDPEQRFRDPDDEEPFSFRGYLDKLFFDDVEMYRLLVFIVADEPYTVSGPVLTDDDADMLHVAGMTRLTSDMREVPFTGDHTCDALVYEFRAGAESIEALSAPTESVAVHLEGSGLAAALGIESSW